jgi:hypothetical protein
MSPSLEKPPRWSNGALVAIFLDERPEHPANPKPADAVNPKSPGASVTQTTELVPPNDSISESH